MEKTIKIGDKDVRLSNNLSWALIYRNQFGQDIIPTLMPLLAGVVDVLGGVLRKRGSGDLTVGDLVAEMMDGDELTNAYIHLNGLEFVDFINLTWALAKCADDSIPEPTMWVRQFDEFPVDIIGPAVFKMLFKGLVSAKNRERLTSQTQKIQPILTPTPSSTQDSSAD